MNNKIVKYLFIIIPVVLIGIIFFFFSQKKSTSPTSITTSTVMSNTQSPTPVSGNMNLASIGTQYKATNYTLTYPKTWQPTTTQQNGASIGIMQSHNIPGNPETIIEYYDAAHSTAEKQMLDGLTECTKANVGVNNNTYEQLTCVYTYRIIDGQEVQGTTQLRMVLIPKANTLYLFKFYYSSPKQDPIYENLAMQILSSLQITQ